MSQQKTSEKRMVFASDEFYNSPVFVMSIIAINENQLSSFVKKWRQLQQKIKTQLLIDAPRLAEKEELSGDRLPEIHAVNLFQSTSPYRLKPSDAGFKPNYWERQHRWITEALNIIRHFNIKIFLLSRQASKEDVKKDYERAKTAYDRQSLAATGKLFAAHSDRFASLSSSPYFEAFPTVILGVDNYLKNSGRSGVLMFDDYEQCKGFCQSDIFDFLRDKGMFGDLSHVSYQESHKHEILQAADVVAYIFGRYTHSLYYRQDDPVFPLLRQLVDNYIIPRIKQNPYGGALKYNRPSAMLMHYVFLAESCAPSGITPTDFSSALSATFLPFHQEILSALQLEDSYQNEPEPLHRVAPSKSRL